MNKFNQFSGNIIVMDGVLKSGILLSQVLETLKLEHNSCHILAQVPGGPLYPIQLFDQHGGKLFLIARDSGYFGFNLENLRQAQLGRPDDWLKVEICLHNVNYSDFEIKYAGSSIVFRVKSDIGDN